MTPASVLIPSPSRLLFSSFSARHNFRITTNQKHRVLGVDCVIRNWQYEFNANVLQFVIGRTSVQLSFRHRCGELGSCDFAHRDSTRSGHGEFLSLQGRTT
ncbi:unnamed protein product, partial [Hapterophycus canaliculatus]